MNLQSTAILSSLYLPLVKLANINNSLQLLDCGHLREFAILKEQAS